MNTKPRVVTETDSRPVCFFITTGQISDYTDAMVLLTGVSDAQWPVADRNYDVDWLCKTHRTLKVITVMEVVRRIASGAADLVGIIDTNEEARSLQEANFKMTHYHSERQLAPACS
ncbi:hypothetical protein QTO30_13705 [Yoonia sp. GPGPB17]|uniref:hypothetical protein n=1 Tax=Yoonia sp. GPGPB17 TaxID=3026147 RepID=UPI0030BD46E5